MRKIPVPLSVVIDTKIDKVYNYYRIARVHATAVKTVIRLNCGNSFTIRKSQFKLFVVKPLPYYGNTLTQFVTVHSDSIYFAVSTNRLSYVY